MHAVAMTSIAAMNMGKHNTHDNNDNNNSSFSENTKNNSSSSSSINHNSTCVSKPILYASITFRPDNHKLRPIASIKATQRENIYNDRDTSSNNNNMKREFTSVTKRWRSEHNKIYPLSNGVAHSKFEKPIFQKLNASPSLSLSSPLSSASSKQSELIEQKQQDNYTNCATKFSIAKMKIGNLMKAALWMLQHCIHDNESWSAKEWHVCKGDRTAGLESVHNDKHDNYTKCTRHNYSSAAVNNDNNAEYLALRSFALHSLKRFRYDNDDDDNDGDDDVHCNSNNTMTRCCIPNVDSLKDNNPCDKCQCNILKFDDNSSTTTTTTTTTTNNNIIRGSDNQVEVSKRHKMESTYCQQEESNTSYLASPSPSFPTLALITCDGYRCYDQLMQSSLINMINELFPSDDAQYKIFFFNAITTTKMEQSVSDSVGTGHQTVQSRLCCHRRPCVRLIRFDNLAKSHEQYKTKYKETYNEEHQYCKNEFSLHLQEKGPLLHIPANTILTEDGRAPSCWHYGMCFANESIRFNKLTSNCREKQCTDTHTSINKNNNNNNATNKENVFVISSNFIKSFLLDHIHNHLIRVNDTWYIQQERGIVQGSPVSMLLCNLLLTHVDQELLSLLEESALHEHCLFTRRVDDILIASTSELAAKTCLARLHQS